MPPLPVQAANLVPITRHAHLATDQLHEFADRHPRRKPVRVHDLVRADTLVVERHVLLQLSPGSGMKGPK